MITYQKFKEIFDNIDPNIEPEIELYFNNRDNTYMIIKYRDFITFQRCGRKEDTSDEIKFSTLDELYKTKTIDDIVLKDEWDNISDIIFDSSFSVVEDREDFLNLYGVEL